MCIADGNAGKPPGDDETPDTADPVGGPNTAAMF